MFKKSESWYFKIHEIQILRPNSLLRSRFFPSSFTFSEYQRMALLPISLMAMIHAVKYGYKVLDTTGWAAGRSLLNFIAVKQQILFRLVALTEIFLMPALIVMVILGRAQLFSPFLYYRYLMLRYMSQRNAYCRQVFYELKMAGDQYKNSPRVPGFLKKAIDMAQKLCLRLVPAQQ